MIHLVTYDTITGVIEQTKLKGPDPSHDLALATAAQMGKQFTVLEVEFDERELMPEAHYVDKATNTIMEKTTFPELDVSLNGVIVGLPANTTVVWPDGEQTVETGSISFDAAAGGDFMFTFYAPKHFIHHKKVAYNVA